MAKRVESIDPEKETMKLASFNTSELTLTKQEAQQLIMEISDAITALVRVGEIKHARQLNEVMRGQGQTNLIRPA